MSQSTKKRMVFSLSPQIEKQLKAEVPARKRSELLEELLTAHFEKMKIKRGLAKIEEIRKRPLKKDAVKMSAVELIRRDRRTH